MPRQAGKGNIPPPPEPVNRPGGKLASWGRPRTCLRCSRPEAETGAGMNIEPRLLAHHVRSWLGDRLFPPALALAVGGLDPSGRALRHHDEPDLALLHHPQALPGD